jgi:acyl carrier protein phosphodiesterase
VNYLGHLLVLPDAGEISLGNMLGDFFKCAVAQVQPERLRLGVALHREIDRFTDAHPAVRRSKSRISNERSRIAGVLVDVFYDHFLIHQADLNRLRQNVLPYVAALPAELQPLPDRVISNSWFGSYRTIEGIGAVLARMEARRRRPLGLAGAEAELATQYAGLAADVVEFYPEVVGFTQAALHRLQSASQVGLPLDAAAESLSGPPENGQSDS